METTEKNDRQDWIDLIRLISIVAVVAIHVNADYVVAWNKISFTDWWISNIYSCTIRFAVPVFIMLSGYLLLEKAEDDKVFFSKRVKKVIIPLFAWSMIFMIFKTNYNMLSIFSMDFVKQFLSDKVYFHLYFLYVIIGLYLITPLLRRMLARTEMRDVYAYIALWFIFTPVVKLFDLAGFHVALPLEAATGFLGYYIIGYAIKKTAINNKVIYFSGIGVTASILIMVAGTYMLTSSKGEFDGTLIGGFSLTNVVYSVGLFILLREGLSHVNLQRWSGLINMTGTATMGVYLFHPILLHYLATETNLLTLNVFSPVFIVPFVTILLVISSLIVVCVLQKIPLVKIIVP